MKTQSNYFNINYIFSPSLVVQRIADTVEGGKAGYICVADGNILQMVHRDPEYRKVINGALFSICDSSWVPVFLKRLYGMEVPQYCGSQIFEDIIAQRKYRMFFLGAHQSILGPLRENLAARYDPGIGTMVFEELPFRKVEDFDYPAIAEKINADNPDIIWVSLGAPKQEIFMGRLAPYLNRGVMIAVGAAFKFYSGVSESRAPEWMVRHHLEFIYRIIQDPRKQISRCWKIVSAIPAIIGEEKKKREDRKTD